MAGINSLISDAAESVNSIIPYKALKTFTQSVVWTGAFNIIWYHSVEKSFEGVKNAAVVTLMHQITLRLFKSGPDLSFTQAASRELVSCLALFTLTNTFVPGIDIKINLFVSTFWTMAVFCVSKIYDKNHRHTVFIIA